MSLTVLRRWSLTIATGVVIALGLLWAAHVADARRCGYLVSHQLPQATAYDCPAAGGAR